MAKLVTKVTGAALVGMTRTKAATLIVTLVVTLVTLSKKFTLGENFPG